MQFKWQELLFPPRAPDTETGAEETPTEETSTETAEETSTTETAETASAITDGTKSTVPADVIEPLTMDSFTLPDGATFDDTLSTKFLDLVNNSELSAQDRAQGLIDLQVEAAQKASELISETAAKTQMEWRKAIETDPKLGGDNLQATMNTIAKPIDKYGGADFRKMLDETGAGNHPAMLNFLHKLATDTTEGTLVAGLGANSQEPVTAATFYPSMTKGTS